MPKGTPTMTIRVVIAEDEAIIRLDLRETLEEEGYQVVGETGRGDQAVELVRTLQPDLAILDIKMPRMDGMETLRRLRQKSDMPVIFLTSKDEEVDELMGLRLGADDYITKPFSPREMLARVRAVLRRYQVQATLPERDNTRRAFRFSGWELNLRTRRLTSPRAASVELSNGEFSLLCALCRSPRRVLTRDQLLSMSRLHEAEVYDRTIDVQIRRLRKKMEDDPSNPGLIQTERGAGYCLASDVETLY
jgi:DNA-binding response OmpR family regulator